MRVMIFEFICGGGLAGREMNRELIAPGGAILCAAVDDFVRAGCEVFTTVDTRVQLNHHAHRIIPVGQRDCAESLFKHALVACDAALVIAPEFDGLLERWSRLVIESGVRHLGCSLEAIRQYGDKLATYEALSAAGVPTPRTQVISTKPAFGFPCVVKPRYGAGCERTWIVERETDWASIPHDTDLIVQPCVRGQVCSVCALVNGDRVTMLPPGRQTVEGQHKLAYHGGELPVVGTMGQRIKNLGERTLKVCRGLNGFVGVDLIITDDPEQDTVIEINPRLTVSYSALSLLCKTSLAQAILQPGSELQWHDRVIRYDARGLPFDAVNA
ncbi:MAG: ATP-grasp domain-containing protein [Phycisphaera sp.]|nr:ATP-grasp domain-containing protein [Phycisphaera sp.]